MVMYQYFVSLFLSAPHFLGVGCQGSKLSMGSFQPCKLASNNRVTPSDNPQMLLQGSKDSSPGHRSLEIHVIRKLCVKENLCQTLCNRPVKRAFISY